MRFLLAAVFCVLVPGCLASDLSAQGLSGTYTCANGNPGAAFDYGNIGSFFDDLENLGVSGPVILDVYDDGGAFVPDNSYVLGSYVKSFTPPYYYEVGPSPVAGLSATNTLTIRAATGETPVISGSGAYCRIDGGKQASEYPGALGFDNVGFITVEGLKFQCAGGYFGIRFVNDVQGMSDHVSVARCEIRDCLSTAISLRTWSTVINNVTIENNMCWGGVTPIAGRGLIEGDEFGIEWVVRHNTVLVRGPSISAFFGQSSGIGNGWDEFVGNIVYMPANIGSGWYLNIQHWQYQKPQLIDYNVVYFAGPVRIYRTSFSITWAQWQAGGDDVNGLNVDPLLMNVNFGQEDLRLQPTSPARDLIPVSGMTEDVFGNPRPMGSGYDAGAHEYPAARMEVEYNTVPVANAGAVHVGDVLQLGETRAFTIRNTHAADLLLTSTPPVILTPGSNVASATVQSQPVLTTIPFNGSTTFTVYIEPAAAGPFDLQVSLANSDAANNPYVFTINGNGITNAAARADPAPASGFTGPPGGPYFYALDPGDPLVNAEIVLSDLEGDAITVTNISQINPPTGVNTPATPPPGQPITLSWTGVMDASNPAGMYQYRVDFQDAVNGTPVSVTLFITNNDLPPTHTIANASAGDGSAGNPYMAAFTEGDDSTNTLDLATLDDVNIGQSVTLAGFSPGTGNPPGGVGFAFTAAGTLTIAPAGTLLPADVGTHTYTVQITDGTNIVNVHVQISVAALPPPPPPIVITTTALPDSEVGQNYAQTIQLTGGSGGFVFTVQTGNLPQGLLLNASTGEITGKPTTAGTETFTIQVIDAANVTATQQYTLNIQPATAPPPVDNNPGGDGPGCIIGGRTGWGAVLLLLPVLVLRRRRA